MGNEFKVGDIVVSVAGHDKNKPFIVVGIDKNGYIAIIDGKYREKNQPKLKNPKHLEKVAFDEEILKKVNSKMATNAEIFKLIKAHIKIKE